MYGRRVGTVYDGELSAGVHHIRYDVSQLPAGVYFSTLMTKGGSITRMMVKR